MQQASLLPAETILNQPPFDGNDPWWAIAARQPHPRPPQHRRAEAAPSDVDLVTPEANGRSRGGGQEFVPVAPKSLSAAGIGQSQIEALVLKFLLSAGSASGREIADQLKLPFTILSELLRSMKQDQLLVYRSSAAANDYEHQLTPTGCDQARRYSEQCTYFGAAPVSLADYTASAAPQSLRRQQPTAEQLRSALSDLVISHDLFSQLGQALWAGTALFLYGDPGNGKTSIAERVIQSYGPYVWIPRAVSVWGEIVRLFDPSVHEPAPISEPADAEWKFDHRWIRIKRPTIVAGGELTRDQLEMTLTGSTGIIESPIHLKSNGGTLLIDDFGRQRISTTELLNRWIVPLEKGHDYLNLPSGKKIQVPFDQLIIFATNLEPRELVDEAFLRRIPYKIEVGDPSEEEFRDLVRIMAPKIGVEYREGPVHYLLEKHYHEPRRRMRYCHPRDLLLQVRNFCLFHNQSPMMTNEAFDAAVKNYFSVM